VREPVDLDLVEAVSIAGQRLTRRTGRTVTLEVPDHAVVRRVDPAAFAEIIGNLLDNAAKFSDGPILVVLTEDSLEVRDAGPGIPEEERAAVFDRFHRTPDARGVPGSGLGLSIVADAVSSMGGTIVLDDAPEGGLSARVSLPSA